jgi:TMEM175 potassium channel family protein
MGQSPGPGRTYNQVAGTSVERLSGISDGIFSVGMTLLVLGLAVPSLGSAAAAATESELWNALAKLGPNVLVYVLSFMTLGIFWVGQGTQLGRLARSNRHYVWIQLAFLLAVTLVPFSTALLAHFPTLKVALVEYWLNIVLLGGTLLAAFEYALRAHLFGETARRDLAPLIRGRILIAQALYATATALAIFFPTWVSIALIALIQLNYVIAPRIPLLHRF